MALTVSMPLSTFRISLRAPSDSAVVSVGLISVMRTRQGRMGRICSLENSNRAIMSALSRLLNTCGSTAAAILF